MILHMLVRLLLYRRFSEDQNAFVKLRLCRSGILIFTYFSVLCVCLCVSVVCVCVHVLYVVWCGVHPCVCVCRVASEDQNVLVQQRLCSLCTEWSLSSLLTSVCMLCVCLCLCVSVLCVCTHTNVILCCVCVCVCRAA